MLLAGFLGGHIAHLLRVPRVVGYLLAGTALRFVLPILFSPDAQSGPADAWKHAAEPLRVVMALALGLILFSIGNVFEVRHLRSVGRNVLRIATAESLLTAGLVFVGVFAACPISGAAAGLGTVLALSLLLGLAAIATAPAATLVTLREYEAKGATTDTILSSVGLNNVICLVGFHLGFLLLASLGALRGVTLTASDAALGILLTTVGSVAIGVAAGLLLSVVHARFRTAESILCLLAVLILLSAAEHRLMDARGVSFNYLLTVLCIGAVFANASIDPDRMDGAIRTVGQPLFVVFFVLAGYQLHLEDLYALRWIGAAYIVCRVAGKCLGAWLGLRWAGRPAELQPAIGLALLCQAAVVIGVAEFVERHWSDPWARSRFVTTVLGSIVVFEISGPLLLKWLAVRAGEVKAVTLLRLEAPSEGGSIAMFRLALAALLRALGVPAAGASRPPGKLSARHLMRANVKCIPADAMFDDVLHMIEHSRFHHFPVVDAQQHLVGVIHLSDIREVIYDPALCNLVTAADLANPDMHAVAPDTPLEALLPIFERASVGSLMVVEAEGSRRVVGVVEQRDILRSLRASNDAAP